jgi:hypothetical protein
VFEQFFGGRAVRRASCDSMSPGRFRYAFLGRDNPSVKPCIASGRNSRRGDGAKWRSAPVCRRSEGREALPVRAGFVPWKTGQHGRQSEIQVLARPQFRLRNPVIVAAAYLQSRIALECSHGNSPIDLLQHLLVVLRRGPANGKSVFGTYQRDRQVNWNELKPSSM